MRTVGSYEILSELGHGGMGRVYRVRHAPTGVERALKVLPPDAPANLVERFRREAEATARFAGQGVVPIHETGQVGPSLYYVMDLMPGGSLRTGLARGGPMPWRDAVELLVPVARTLARCHAAGLIHRDVKPENILQDDEGRARLADFGCVKDMDAESLTASGHALGTFVYMPPEQLRGASPDPSVDVFALAIVLHELVAGAHPYGATEIVETLVRMEQGQRARLQAHGAPAALDGVIDRALAGSSAARTSATAFADELEAVLRGESPGTSFASSRRVRVAALVGLLGVVVVAALPVLGRPADRGGLAPRPADATGDDEALRAWSSVAASAYADGRYQDALAAAERGLARLRGVAPARTRGLKLVRARALARLGRGREAVAASEPADRAETARAVARVLAESGRWEAVLEVEDGDPEVSALRAWARHRTERPAAEDLAAHERLAVELEAIPRLGDALRASGRLVRARVALEKAGATALGDPSRELGPLLDALVADAREADPLGRERGEELALLERLVIDRGIGIAPFAERIDATGVALAKDAGDASGLLPLRVACETISPGKGWLGTGPLFSERAAWLDAHLVPAPGRYRASARAIAIRGLELRAIARSIDAATLLEGLEALPPVEPDEGDARLGARPVDRRSVAAVAAALAAGKDGARRATLLARAHDHLDAPDAPPYEIKNAEGVGRFVVALAEGDDAAARRIADMAPADSYEGQIARAEVARRAGRFEAALLCYAAHPRSGPLREPFIERFLADARVLSFALISARLPGQMRDEEKEAAARVQETGLVPPWMVDALPPRPR